MHFGKINSRERDAAVVVQACRKAVGGRSSLALQAPSKVGGTAGSAPGTRNSEGSWG